MFEFDICCFTVTLNWSSLSLYLFDPHCLATLLQIITQSFSFGITKKEYFPAGNFEPSIIRSLSVSKIVASLAPALQIVLNGTNSPQITLPFTDGLLYLMVMVAPFILPVAIAAGLTALCYALTKVTDNNAIIKR